MTKDRELLNEFCRDGSETAFRQLVEQHLHLVYSAAMRVVNGDVHLAQDISQTVFSGLARKAASLPPNVVLAGWLHRHTRFTALGFLRKERRRVAREREAATMHELETPGENVDWSRLRPTLDEVLDKLHEDDRHALLLRFFEQQNLADVGAALGLSEDTARKRVSRALDQLRHALLSRGITTTASFLSLILTTRGVETIPAGLSAHVTRTAVAAGGTTTSGFLALMTTTKLATLIVASTAALLMGAAAVKFSRSLSRTDAATAPTSNESVSGASRNGSRLFARRAGPGQAGANEPSDPAIAVALARLREVLYDPSNARQLVIPPPQIREAMAALGDQGQAAIPLLREALENGSSRVKERAACGLALLGPGARDEAAAMVKALQGPGHLSSLGFTWALGQLGPNPETLPSMIEVLKANPGHFASMVSCITTMAGTDPKVLDENVRPLLQDPDFRIRQAAASVLVDAQKNSADAGIVKIAIESLKSKDVNAEYLGMETVEKVARDPANPARLTSANLGPSAADVMAALTQVANHSTMTIRRTKALRMLNELNPDLRKQNSDMDAWLTGQSDMDAFTDRIRRQKATVPEMIQGLRQFPEAVPVTASTLGKLGPEARAALPALQEALAASQPRPEDSDYDRSSAYEAREKIANAIQKIAPDQPKPLFTKSDVRSMWDDFGRLSLNESRKEALGTALQPVLAQMPGQGKELTPDEMRRVLNAVKAIDAPAYGALSAAAKKIDPHFSTDP